MNTMKPQKALSILLVLILLTGIVVPYNQVSAAKKVKLNKSKVTLEIGKKVTLKLKNNTSKVTWTSSKKKIATVTAKGKVTAKKIGNCKITAKADGKKYTCKIKVVQSRSEDDIAKPSTPGATEAPTAVPTNVPAAAPTEAPTTPTEAPATPTEAPATPTAPPEAETIIVLSSTAEVMDIGESKAISVTVTPTTKQSEVEWISSDTNIATVSGGIVTGVTAGTTTIIAQIGTVQATCTVQVNQTYGSVTGNVTYYYNKYQGNKPDTGTWVYLISKTGSALNMPEMNSYVTWQIASSMKDYEDYGIYTTRVDGSGNYTFNNIPTGDYLIFMCSEKTTDSIAFEDLNLYKNMIMSSVSKYVKPKNATYLGSVVGHQKFNCDSITVLSGQTVTNSYDFGITYI